MKVRISGERTNERQVQLSKHLERNNKTLLFLRNIGIHDGMGSFARSPKVGRAAGFGFRSVGSRTTCGSLTFRFKNLTENLTM